MFFAHKGNFNKLHERHIASLRAERTSSHLPRCCTSNSTCPYICKSTYANVISAFIISTLFKVQPFCMLLIDMNVTIQTKQQMLKYRC